MDSSVSEAWLAAGGGSIWAPVATAALEYHSRCFDQSNFLFSSPCFRRHLHSCFSPEGTLTQQAGLPQHQHNETGCERVCVCVCVSVCVKEHTPPLPFSSSQGRGKKHWRTLSDGGQIRAYSFRGLHRGRIFKGKYSPGAAWVGRSSAAN